MSKLIKKQTCCIATDGSKTYTCETGDLDRNFKYGPAVTGADGRLEYRSKGKLHRKQTHGPAVVTTGGEHEYWVNGVRHCDFAPAVVRTRLGEAVWFKNGELHRNPNEGPAVILRGGEVKQYWVNGSKRNPPK
jgi:hypothetical protein